MIEIRDLSATLHHELVGCFIEAFEGYFVKMPADPDYYRRRWQEERVDLSVSYGAFNDGRLVGFMLHGVDLRSGKLAAHNAATGVLPGYRGKGLAGQMYQVALPEIRRRDIRKLTLEVICDNASAICAYEKAGFRIDRTLHCFLGQLPDKGQQDLSLQAVPIDQVAWESRDQSLISWGNHSHCFSDDNAELFHVFRGEKMAGWFVINKGRDRIYQFDVAGDDEAELEALFTGMARTALGELKIINVDSTEKAKLAALRRSGIKNYIDQYEMIFEDL